MTRGQGELPFDGEPEAEPGPADAARRELESPSESGRSLVEGTDYDPDARRDADQPGWASHDLARAKQAAERERIGNDLQAARENLNRILERDERDYPKPEDPK